MSPNLRGGTMKCVIWILWPSFIVAGVMDIVFFTLFDPLELLYDGGPLFESRLAAYSLGFIAFWVFAAASVCLTLFFQRDSAAINRLCPLEPKERPVGCPIREEDGVCEEGKCGD